MKPACCIFALVLFLISGSLFAKDFSRNPSTSFFIGLDLGVGFDPVLETRSPPSIQPIYNAESFDVEAYSLASFVFGIYGGYRFNEFIGIEGGWHDQQHDAHPEWGGIAYYQIGHLALRLAWPTASRQTPVLKIGPAIGGFAYGASSIGYEEDNRALVVGGLTGLVLEHEFILGLVGMLEVNYIPLCRFGMDDELHLIEYRDDETTTREIKDFTDNRFVQVIWVKLGIQFEWTFR